MDELLLLLKKFFGYTSFRPLQADIIRRIDGSMTATLELIEIGNDIHWLEEAGLLDE